jgi:predicted nucleotidyltransferase
MRTEHRLEILEDELERFVRVASEELGAEKIILFGSLAREKGAEGSIGEWSDLDLVVITETEQPFYARIKDLLLKVRPRTGVDVFIYTPAEWERLKAGTSFAREEMVDKGKVVYERTE